MPLIFSIAINCIFFKLNLFFSEALSAIKTWHPFVSHTFISGFIITLSIVFDMISNIIITSSIKNFIHVG